MTFLGGNFYLPLADGSKKSNTIIHPKIVNFQKFHFPPNPLESFLYPQFSPYRYGSHRSHRKSSLLALVILLWVRSRPPVFWGEGLLPYGMSWEFPKIGGKPPKMDVVKIMEKPLLIHGWFGGKTHHFRKPPVVHPRNSNWATKKKHLITFQYYTGWIL